MAAAGRELRLMFPMVTTVKEYRTARAKVDRAAFPAQQVRSETGLGASGASGH